MSARTDEGWALVSVLWTVAMLAMMAGAIQMLTLTSYRSEASALTHEQVDAALDAAVVRGILGIGDDRIDRRWRVDGVPQTFAFAGSVIRVSVQDELGRYDLNVVDDTTLRQILRDAGLDQTSAETMSDRILDWRSKTNGITVRLHSASDADYESAGLAWRPRHGPFQSIDELRLVLGMTPELFARIRPALTVYTTQPSIDPQIATRESLLALFQGDAAKVENLMRLRDATAAPAQNENIPNRPGLLNPSMPLVGRAFEITAEIRRGQQRFVRSAVVEMTGDPKRPYLVMDWH